jgi:hypothetical protein
MAKPQNEDDGSKENPLSKLLSRFRPTPELFPEEIVELDEEIEKALWFDPKPFLKNVSLPNIFFGSILGAVIAFATIFAPFFLPDDLAFPSGKSLHKLHQIYTFSCMTIIYVLTALMFLTKVPSFPTLRNQVLPRLRPSRRTFCFSKIFWKICKQVIN